MPAERYYFPHVFQHGTYLSIKDQEFHHLVNVMRSRQGDSIELVNGKGQLATGIIDIIEKKSAVIKIEEIYVESPSPKKLILAQGIPRLNRLEFILEKGTELGMSEIWLFPAIHSEKKIFSENQLERLQSIIIAAMKQSGRLFLPDLKILPQLKQWPMLPKASFFGDLRSEAPILANVWPSYANCDETLFVIGPESGFDEREILQLEKLGALGVKLHPNILRTDTAAITALSLLSHWMLT